MLAAICFPVRWPHSEKRRSGRRCFIVMAATVGRPPACRLCAVNQSVMPSGLGSGSAHYRELIPFYLWKTERNS